MLAIALGLGSAACWGVADFFAGLSSRRLPVLAVLLVSQLAGLVVVAGVVVAQGDGPPGAEDLLPAAIAGAAGNAALAAFYRGLAIGTMSIIAPISATGAALPVVVGIATGERPSALQALGIVLAVVGVVLASRERHEDESGAAAARAAVLLALVAAVGFGCFFVAMNAAADGGIAWAVLTARATTVTLIVAVVLAGRRSVGVEPSALPPLVLVGLLDISANALYALATQEGLLSVVAVLGSLYPLATVLLARVLLGERLQRAQDAGIVATLAGVALIASA